MNKLLSTDDSSVVTVAKLVKLLRKLLKQGTKRFVCEISWVESCTENLKIFLLCVANTTHKRQKILAFISTVY